MLRRITIFLSAIFLFLFSSGCSMADNHLLTENSAPSSVNYDDVTIWLVTENTTADGMIGEIETIADQFETLHPNISIQIDILPTDEKLRDAYLEMLREQMTAGTGPDVFLLPTSNTLVLDQPTQYTYLNVSPLFSNVDLAMREGSFLDISSFYNSDKTLKKEALNEVVMDAGTIGDARYALPLRYNIPVLYSFNDDANEYGIKTENYSKNINEWMEYILSINDPLIACGAEYCSYNALSNFIDYENNRVNLTEDELSEYLSALQEIRSLIGSESGHRANAWIDSYINDLIQSYPIRIGPLSDSITYAAISKVESKKLSMHPVKTSAGEYIATISYYGAIGSNCTYPEIAYEFLAMFLSEESQWEINRSNNFDNQYSGLLEQSWPVRTLGSVESLWSNQQKQAIARSNSSSTVSERIAAIRNMEIIQEDIEILNYAISYARFPLPCTLNEFWHSEEDFTDVQILAKRIILELNKEIQ